MTPPDPPAAIPDFLLDQFAELPPTTLRDIGAYAREETAVAPDSVPDSVVTAFALQDDETIDAVASYVDSLAAFLEERDADSLAAVTGDRGDDAESWGHNRILDWHS